jgi:hypothetical protein
MYRRVAFALCVIGGLLPLTAFGDDPAPMTSIYVQQISISGALGTLILTNPAQTDLEQKGADFTVSHPEPGLYTLYVIPPEGSTARITLSRNGTPAERVNLPQISFQVNSGEEIRILVEYDVTRFGSISVISSIDGVPFTMRGPNDMKEEGVTPQTYPKLPVGQYNVQYVPGGDCILPRPQSQVLDKNERIQFNITLDCSPNESPSVEEKKEEQPVETAPLEGSVVPIDATITSEPPRRFTDVPESAWFFAYVQTVADAGILRGYKDASGAPTGEFGPERPVTIAELSKIAHTLGKIDAPAPTRQPWSRGAIGMWYEPYIVSAEDHAWTIYVTKLSSLVRPATRGEVVVTLLQALDVPLHWAKGNVFTDVKVDTKFASAIETAKIEGWISGRPDGSFDPTGPVNRAEMAKMVSVILEAQK